MPRCSRCTEIKLASEFYARNRDGRRAGSTAYCKACYSEYSKPRNAARYARNRQIIDESKAAPCADCGVQYQPWIMDLDHRDPTAKIDGVSQSIVTWSVEKLVAEIAKCDVVCANCHRHRHHARGGDASSLPVLTSA